MPVENQSKYDSEGQGFVIIKPEQDKKKEGSK